MKYHGIPWHTITVKPWSTIENHVMLNGTIVYNHGWPLSSISMVNHWIPWLTVVTDTHGNPWNTMVDHEIPCFLIACNDMTEYNGRTWFTMKDNGLPWIYRLDLHYKLFTITKLTENARAWNCLIRPKSVPENNHVIRVITKDDEFHFKSLNKHSLT